MSEITLSDVSEMQREIDCLRGWIEAIAKEVDNASDWARRGSLVHGDLSGLRKLARDARLAAKGGAA